MVPVWLLLLGCLAGCDAVPLSASNGPRPLYAVMQPSCLFLCSNPVSAIREDVDGGLHPITTGTKTVTQTTPTKPKP